MEEARDEGTSGTVCIRVPNIRERLPGRVTCTGLSEPAHQGHRSELPPGGPGDIISRAFAEKAAPIVGKPFIQEYRAGASTTIGTAAAAKADPDGYTVLALPSSGTGAVAIKKQLRYNLETDFSPIAGVGTVPLVLVVRSGLNIKTMADFTAAARAGKLMFGTAGVGTIGHLSALFLMNEVQGKATHVPFKGNPEVTQALIGGHVDFSILSVADAAPYAGVK